MNQKDVWKKYITAQSKILEHKSRPIGIDTTKPVQLNGLKLHLTIDQEIFKQVFKKEVEDIFKIEDFDFESGYILTTLTDAAKITSEQLAKLRELAEICYIDFNENPVIEGTITSQENNIKNELRNVIGELPTNEFFKNTGQIFLTIEEWRKVSAIDGIEFSKIGTARFNIKPSVKLIAETKFNQPVFLDNFQDLATSEELPKEIFEYLNTNLGIRVKQINLLIKFDDDENNHYLESAHTFIKQNTNFYPYKTADNYLLIRLEKKKLRKTNYETYESAEISINNILIANFPNQVYKIEKKYFYSFDRGADHSNFFNTFLKQNEVLFHSLVKTTENQSIFRLDQSYENIYIDFTSEDDLNQKIKSIESIPYFDIYGRGKYHKFKFNIKFETGLYELQANLKKEFPNLNTKLIANGEKLIFRKFYKAGDGNKGFERDKLNDQLYEFLQGTEFTHTIDVPFEEKYLCEENFELKVEQEEEKLSKLIRTEFFVCDQEEKKLFDIGTLTRVEYPNLTFTIEAENAEIVEQWKNEIIAIKPDLKGERDKIERLKDAVNKLDSNQPLPNNNAKEFLYDSSKAKIIENIDYLLNKTSAEWQDFENNLFSTSLNESQRKAIFKSLYAEELALIQGPPGTGKSTAIAEIIWQHIRKEPKQKILLTSETNLAVDNAIDRLKNDQNNIIKPIRFGNTDNLESEGYFYSLEAIENWQKSNSNESNTVSHWVSNIANRVKLQDDEQIDSALEKWKTHLHKPNSETKKLFADKYLEHVNLIGATGSSIGKLNSENKWTSFFNSYLNVFEREKYEKRTLSKYNWQDCERVNVSFDTIIMDEASKATPPELALPVLFGKKSIIVGDHRQLPPMIDGEEIKETLKSTGDKEAIELAKLFSQKDFQISQFERLFNNIDDSIKGTFDTQYRMHPAINNVISQFYEKDGGLKCGLPLEEIHHNSYENPSRYHGLLYKNILTPETHTIWVNLTTPEIQDGTSRVNFGEIEAIDNILTVLNNSQGKNEFNQWLSNKSLEEKQIGLISFYGKQIHYINKMLKEKHSEVPIRLSTVDRFQGMERNIIIVSMVRSNKLASFQGQQPDEIYGELGYPLQESLGFAESPNRLNVALSRARRLLIVVGNSEHFCRVPIYKNVYEKMQKIISAEELQKAVEQNG